MKAIPTCIAFAAMAGTVLAQAEQRRSDCEAHRARDGGALAVRPPPSINPRLLVHSALAQAA
jgi:hypothetical protein